jgi:GIY-YIG catalytic domain
MTRLCLDEDGLLHHDFICENSKAFKNRPAVYFLVHAGEVVYVGKAINVHARIGTHMRDREKLFERVYVLHCDREELNALERAYIRKFQPRYNSYSAAHCEVDGERVLATRAAEEPMQSRKNGSSPVATFASVLPRRALSH